MDGDKPVPFTAARPALPAAPAPKLPVNGDFAYVDEFDGDALSMQWVGIRTPRRPFYAVTGGALQLETGAALGDLKGAPGPITLTIRTDGGRMGFDNAVGGTSATLLDRLDAGLLNTARAGGFVGTVVDPYHYRPAD